MPRRSLVIAVLIVGSLFGRHLFNGLAYAASPSAFVVTTPANEATVSGTITVAGTSGSEWVNVAVYDANNGYAAVSTNVTPSGGDWSTTVNTNVLVYVNGDADIAVVAFSVPAGESGGTSTSVNLSLVVGSLCSVTNSPYMPRGDGRGGCPGWGHEFAVPANDFLNSIGIDFGGESTLAEYATLMSYIGVRNFRYGCEGGGTAAYAIQLARATNTKASWGLGSGWGNASWACTDDLAQNVIAPAKALAAAGVLLALEGPNEPDNWNVTYKGQVGGGGDNAPAYSWVPVAELQRDFYAAVKGDPVLKSYAVWDLSHGGAEIENVGLQCLTIPRGSGLVMPDGTHYAGYANMHNYVMWSNATAPYDNSAWWAADPLESPLGETLANDYGTTWRYGYAGYSNARLESLPRVTTETGWGSNVGGKENQGRILLSVLLSQFKRGYKYTFLYQLVDNEGGFENEFGIVRSDYSYKPAAIFIHNLTQILSDNRSLLTRSLKYKIPNEPETVHDLLLQKSNGMFELVVWDDRPIGEARDKVTVELGGTRRTVDIYDPTVGTTKVQTYNDVNSVQLTLTDHPLILEVAKDE